MFALAVGAEVVVAGGCHMACSFEWQPVMQEFVDAHAVSKGKFPNGQLDHLPVDVLNCSI